MVTASNLNKQVNVTTTSRTQHLFFPLTGGKLILLLSFLLMLSQTCRKSTTKITLHIAYVNTTRHTIWITDQVNNTFALKTHEKFQEAVLMIIVEHMVLMVP